MSFLISAQDLVLTKGQPPLTLSIGPGLTLIHHAREAHASALTLAIAGRFRPAEGTISLIDDDGTHTGTRDRFSRIALAGATEIDSLERGVSVRETLREQLAWSLPFYAWVPRDVVAHPRVAKWWDVLLPHVDPNEHVGDIAVQDRFLLRIVLALIARPQASALLVDDIDQLRDMSLRGEVLSSLSTVAQSLPVIVNTVNGDVDGLATDVITLREIEKEAA